MSADSSCSGNKPKMVRPRGERHAARRHPTRRNPVTPLINYSCSFAPWALVAAVIPLDYVLVQPRGDSDPEGPHAFADMEKPLLFGAP